RAERYRFLNEPGEAESICMDVLRVEPDNQKALVTLLLALTDQLEHSLDITEGRAVLTRLRGEYEQAYYAGIICERRAKALMRHGGPGSGYVAYDGLREAMSWDERAEALRPPGDDDAHLRLDTCPRILRSHPSLQAGPQERWEPPLE